MHKALETLLDLVFRSHVEIARRLVERQDRRTHRGKRRELAPLDADGWDESKPVYLEFPGWEEPTSGVRGWNKLPAAARAYVRSVEELAETHIALVATGADRDDTIVLRDPFA